MRFDVLTLFPDFFSSPLSTSVVGKAVEKGLVEVRVANIRDYASDRHKTTDDYPYGGGAGMVMKAGPAVAAIEAAAAAAGPDAPVILTTPQGLPYTQRLARELALSRRLVIFCGRYEGYDERIREFVDLEVSVGDYILSGGETAAFAIIDSVSRLVPGVLGSTESPQKDSFSDGLLEHPQYTRPEEFRGMKVPEVLLSGNHAAIAGWRRIESIKRTFFRRPELLDAAPLTAEERRFVEGLRAGAAHNDKE